MPLAERLDEVVDHKLTHVETAMLAPPGGGPPGWWRRKDAPLVVTAGESAPGGELPPLAPPALPGPLGDAEAVVQGSAVAVLGAPVPPPPPLVAPVSTAVVVAAPAGTGPVSAAPAAGGASPQALEALIRFIPLGLTSAYVAATAPIGEDQRRVHLYLLLLFVLLSAVTSWVGFAVSVRRKIRVPVTLLLGRLRIWPKWQMVAGVVAFISWGVAIHPAALQAVAPGAPDQVARTVAAIGVVIVGYMLTTLDQLVTP